MGRRHYVLSIRSAASYALVADGAALAMEGGDVLWDVVPAPPLGTISDLTATAGVESAVLAWTPAENATSHQPQYRITGAWLDFGSPLGGSASGVTVTGLTADTLYEFRVVAGDGSTTTTSNVDTATPEAASEGPVWRGNEPSGLTALHDEAIGDWGTIPTSNDAPIPNSGVNIVGNAAGVIYTRVSGQTPPRGAPYAVEVFTPDGMASGQGGSAVYAVIPNREVVYVCVYHKIPVDFEENSVSSKLFRFTFSGGDILVQLNRFENYFEAMNFGTPLTGAVDREDIITGEWVLHEVLLDRANGRISTWLDGVPVTVNAAVSTGSGPTSVWFDSTWGGSTAPKSGDSVRWFSDFYISGGDA